MLWRRKVRTAAPTTDIAVLLIDMQTEFVKSLPRGEKERIVPAQIEVIRRCGREGIPLFVIEYERGGDTLIELSQEVEGIKATTRVIRMSKSENSAFLGTNLKKTLRALGVKRLFLMGINAGCCVKETAEDAIKSKFSIVTSPEVVSAALHHSQDHSIGWYGKNGRCVTPATAF